MKITIARFTKHYTTQWNEFLGSAKNGLFLFDRSYVEYHEDRYTDHSLLIYRQDKLIALFTANENEQRIYSHAGLTFGGLLFSKDLKGSDALQVMESMLQYYRALGFKEVYYKAIPHIFHQAACQEDLYALFRFGATLYRRDISSVIDLKDPIRFSESKRQTILKCGQAGVIVQENHDFTAYWELLSMVLAKFGVTPVHTLKEINLLKETFPSKVRLFEARLAGELLAGVVVYDYNNVVHTQYMANSVTGRTMGALDYINAKLIGEVFSQRKYYSFGISTENEGTVLNEGLIQQKEMMGGRAIVYDFYKISL